LNRQFHEIVIQKTENQRLISIINNLEDQLQRFRTLSSRLEGRLCKSAEEHTPVFLAFRERDAEKVEQMFRAHLSSVLEDLFREGL
jgi:DNA-binding GntR family transcriptional regulator